MQLVTKLGEAKAGHGESSGGWPNQVTQSAIYDTDIDLYVF